MLRPPTSHRNLITVVLICLGISLTGLPLQATSVVPPKFEDLVSQSEYVVRAVVKSVTCEWLQNGANRHIITRVELDVREVITGTPPAPLVLTMLGGRIGEDQLVVDGAPGFQVGDEHILFVRSSAKKLFPLVAMMHGQYRILRDAKTGAVYVARSNGDPLYNEQDVARPMSRAGMHAVQAAGAAPLTPEAFASKIRDSVQQNNQQQLQE